MSGILVTITMPYTRDILRLAADVAGRVGFAEIGEATELRSRSCGARVAVAVELDADGHVRAVRQAVEACAFGQAAAAIMGANARGWTATGAQAVVGEVERWLRGEEGPAMLAPLEPVRDLPGRHEAVLLPFRALAKAIEESRR
jgi:NifU-like protein involved in Fe-S cluster formation